MSSTTSGSGSAIITSAKGPNGETGSLTGALVPKSAREAEEMALALTGDLLPPSVQQWLNAMEHHKLVAASIPGKHPPSAPTLTAEERVTVAQAADRALMRQLLFNRQDVELVSLAEGKNKSPDFKIMKNGEIKAYCELKSPRDDWIFDVPKDLKPGEI
jgi:hypothetical protein